MAHESQKEYFKRVKNDKPWHFVKKKVLDVGSLDINGNNKHLFEQCDYVGIDLGAGKNVDIIGLAHEHKGNYDTIISSSCFEHDRYWEKTLKNICEMLNPGGLFLFTCGGKHCPVHGIKKKIREVLRSLQAGMGGVTTTRTWGRAI